MKKIIPVLVFYIVLRESLNVSMVSWPYHMPRDIRSPIRNVYLTLLDIAASQPYKGLYALLLCTVMT